MKNVGVPETPLRSALSTSSAMRPAPAWVRRSSSKRSTSRPISRAQRDEVAVLVGLGLQQHVVHLPERVLLGRGLDGLGGQLGARVDVVQRQVAPHVAQLGVAGEQLADDRLGLAAVGALEVAVLDEGHRGLARAADVVAVGVDRGGEVDDERRGAEERARAGALWQQQGRAEDDPGRGSTTRWPR